MRLRLLLIMFLSFNLMIFTENVNWYTEYDKALIAADSENKNIFVLITAPSWCGWCINLENNVLSNKDFQKKLIDNYIALKLLDKVDGKYNPELENFEFTGYPSVYLYDRKGFFIENIYTQDPTAMIQSMIIYKDADGKPKLSELKLPEKYTFENDGGGSYINNYDSTWTMITPSGEITYIQLKYDYDHIYLGLESGPEYVTLPLKGNKRHLCKLVDDQWIWSELPDVKRFGGDKFSENIYVDN